MKTEIQPHESIRAEAFRMWMASPMPMVTLVKTLDVCRLVKVSKRNGMKFTMMMCWCIGKTASQVEEFFTLPVDGKFKLHVSWTYCRRKYSFCVNDFFNVNDK